MNRRFSYAIRRIIATIGLLGLSGCHVRQLIVQSRPTNRTQIPIKVDNINKKVPPPDWTPSVVVAEMEVKKSSPHSGNVRYKLGLALYKAGRYSDAVAVLSPLSLKLPNKPEVCFWLGLCYVGENRLDDAITAFQHVTQVPGVPQSYKAASFASMGHLYYDLHEDSSAEQACRSALEVDQANVEAKTILTDIHK